jgi:oxygen-independent coproporphyrinogen-3 oxidase
MNVAAVREYYSTRRQLQPGTKIQYGHPSPRFWRPRSLSLADMASLRQPERPLFLYLHIPFCPQTDPPACGFCLFAREDFTGYPAVRRYLNALESELDLQAQVFGGERLDCVYFGGGTPNVLKPADYGRVMDAVRSRFQLSDDVEVTLEGVPQLFDDARLEAMAAAGITRVSIGVQQLKAELVAYSGRKQTAEQVFRAMEKAHALGMVVNVDLICGWFDQQVSDVDDDLAQLLPLRPESVVVHQLTLAGPSAFAQQKARLPSADQTCEAFLAARDTLHQQGYWSSSATDYMLGDPPRGPREVRYLRYYRDFLNYDRLGVGYGANSLFAGTLEHPGMTWRNVANIPSHDRLVGQGMPPCEAAFSFESTDLRLLYVLKGLEGTPYLRADAYRARFGRDLETDFEPHWMVLREMGWLVTSPDGEYRLNGEGVFYISMVQRCITEDRNAELRAEREPAVSAACG